MTGAEMADLLDVSESMVSRIRSGERQPSLDLMLKIRGTLGWSIEDQADAIKGEHYAGDFKELMDRSDARAI